MARSRNIKPSFFVNEDLVSLPYEYRLLFIGLWCMADREGRLENRPKKIKMTLFPADALDVPEALLGLAQGDLITLYAVDNVDYIEIDNFLKHQHPHHKEAKSTIPAQPLPGKTETSPSVARLIPDSLKHEPDSGALIPESRTLIPDAGKNTLSSKHDDCLEILNFLNSETGKNFKPVASNIKFIKARLAEGHTTNDLISVIKLKCTEWKTDQKFCKYLRPATLFNAEKFNQYVAEIGVETPEQQKQRELIEWTGGTK